MELLVTELNYKLSPKADVSKFHLLVGDDNMGEENVAICWSLSGFIS